MGRTDDAEHCYATALTNRFDQVDDLVAVARFCANRGWLGPAVTNYTAAIELDPSDPGLRMEAGKSLAAFGRHVEAARQYRAAVDLEPDQAQPHIELGFELGRLGKSDMAEQEFRQVLRLDSNSIDARVALGVALYEQRKLEDARKQFEDVLRRNSTDATALQFVQLLRTRTPAPAAR